MLEIRPYAASDWKQLWPILKEVFLSGSTYVYPPDISEAEAEEAWITKPLATFVAVDGTKILGTYYIQANQPGLGAHVCNCGYIVSAEARGQGIASRLCEHSQAIARHHGFVAMQFNLVVSTNETAIRLWKKHQFEIIGTVPFAFRHADQGYVDAHIMFKLLKPVSADEAGNAVSAIT